MSNTVYFSKFLSDDHTESFGEAMKYLNQQIEEYPKSVEAYAMRARVLMEQNKYGNALTDINKAIKFWKKGDRTKQYTLYWWRAVIYSNIVTYQIGLFRGIL